MSDTSIRLLKWLSIAALMIPVLLRTSLDSVSFWLLVFTVTAIAVLAQFAKTTRVVQRNPSNGRGSRD